MRLLGEAAKRVFAERLPAVGLLADLDAHQHDPEHARHDRREDHDDHDVAGPDAARRTVAVRTRSSQAGVTFTPYFCWTSRSRRWASATAARTAVNTPSAVAGAPEPGPPVAVDRPKANAIDLATSRAMGEVFRDFRDDTELRVAIIDDHHAVRLGLRTALLSEPGLEPVGSAANAGETAVLFLGVTGYAMAALYGPTPVAEARAYAEGAHRVGAHGVDCAHSEKGFPMSAVSVPTEAATPGAARTRIRLSPRLPG